MNSLVKFLTVALKLFLVANAQEKCSDSTPIFINSAQAIVVNESLEVHGGFTYPRGFWQHENGNYTGCPCMIKKCITHCTNVESTSSTSKKFIRQIIPSWHHFHHHEAFERTTHGDKINILTDDGNWTKDFFEEFYPIDEPTDAEAYYMELHRGSLNTQEIINYYLGDRICFLIENQTLIIYEKIEESDVVAVCLLVSVCSLIVLLAVFYISKETKFLHGKSIACQSLCLIVAFTGLGLDKLYVFERFQCTLIAYITYFFLTSSFFWLNAMCFDMFWTFCYCTTGSNISDNKSKFKLYSCYAWLCPFLMTLGVIFATVNVKEDSVWTTGIGTLSCFISGDSTHGPWLYFYGPLLVVLLLNFLFFFATLIKICQTQKELRRILRVGSSSQKKYENNRKFFMYVKLFAVMGGSWIMELVSWIVDQHDGVWHIFDIINSLRGLWLLIFCVVLSKRVRVGVRRSLSLQYSESKSSANRNPTTVVTPMSKENEQLEMNMIDEAEPIPIQTDSPSSNED